ncbi:PQQ-binding-like beta-propeller repeat protein [Levilactobacillus tangyuanensis]|uniref:PQQ-binding-like beta-propeller repeat protein n=1 Tax=Levilactobacillus tangyuanensis TaxID=2486021 RepID=A0ABW1TNW1_9LACO|nr:PQQ-binding-like beta-propeller repeat protein [Levilactobacillus tangyuanensis]
MGIFSGWKKHRHEDKNQSTAPESLATKATGTPQVQWTREFEQSLYVVRVDQDGQAIVGGANGFAAKISPTQETLWSHRFLSAIRALTVDHQNNLLFGDISGDLSKFNRQLEADWTNDLLNRYIVTMAADNQDNIIVGNVTGQSVQKVTKAGGLDWTTSFDAPIDTLACDGKGNTYVGSNGVVTKLDADGQEQWQQPVTGKMQNIVVNDAIWVATSGVLFKFDFDGNQVWSTSVGGRNSVLAVGPSGDLYHVYQTNDRRTAYERLAATTGDLVWETTSDASALPVSVSAGKQGLYVVFSNNTLQLISEK